MKANNGNPNTHHHVLVTNPTTMNVVHTITKIHSSLRAIIVENSPLNHQDRTNRTAAERLLAVAAA